jgi:U32 family peptidase
MKKVELLAPAGSFEALAAALQAGADAVYFGIEQLNMRARASNNFVVEDLDEIVSRCHGQNVKAYLTVNTVLFNHDLTLMRRIVQAAKAAQVDAIIASDPAVMAYAKEVGMPVHISTQANVTNIEALSFYAHFGDLVVLARELSLKQVKEMAREIERRQIKGPSGNLVKLEIFAHGALCMAVSGKCYLSLHSHNASANRGACVQNCRRTYEVTDREDGTAYEIDNEYIMSAKDLCTIDFLDKIVDTGVAVVKLEGRARAADYVYTVTKCYKEALTAIAEGTYLPDKIEVWKQELDKVYNRGFWDGYYLGRKMGEWSDSYGSVATTKKIFVGKMTHFFNKISVGQFQMETQQLKVGDEIMSIGSVSGVHQQKVTELRVEDQAVTTVEKGQVFSMPLEKPIKSGDRLYKIVDA